MRTFVGLGVAAALTLAGCASESIESKLVGKWKGQIEMPEAKKDDPAAAMAQAFGSMMSMEIEFLKDKTFKMMAMIVPVEGTWTVSGNKITATPTKVMGMSVDDAKKMATEQAQKNGQSLSVSDDINKPIDIEISPDGKTLTMIGTGADRSVVKLTKQSS